MLSILTGEGIQNTQLRDPCSGRKASLDWSKLNEWLTLKAEILNLSPFFLTSGAVAQGLGTSNDSRQPQLPLEGAADPPYSSLRADVSHRCRHFLSGQALRSQIWTSAACLRHCGSLVSAGWDCLFGA